MESRYHGRKAINIPHGSQIKSVRGVHGWDGGSERLEIMARGRQEVLSSLLTPGVMVMMVVRWSVARAGGESSSLWGGRKSELGDIGSRVQRICRVWDYLTGREGCCNVDRWWRSLSARWARLGIEMGGTISK